MINNVPAGNVYPGLSETLGQMATPEEFGPTPAALEAGLSPETERAQQIGGQASPIVGFVVFLVLVIATMWIAHRLGRDGEMADLKASAYNVLLVSWIAILGIPVWKWLFTKLPIPGVTPWVHAV